MRLEASATASERLGVRSADMPRDAAIGHGRYGVARLMERHRDAKLTDLFQETCRLPEGPAQSASTTGARRPTSSGCRRRLGLRWRTHAKQCFSGPSAFASQEADSARPRSRSRRFLGGGVAPGRGRVSLSLSLAGHSPAFAVQLAELHPLPLAG
jgi:hypothetical protein